LFEYGRSRFTVGHKLLEVTAIVSRKPFERERPEHDRSTASTSPPAVSLLKSSTCQYLQVVQYLERNSQMLGHLRDPASAYFSAGPDQSQPAVEAASNAGAVLSA